ncbi:RING finger protein 212B-like isoform X1 [Macrosteles quadrilineatus]|uniref:RING finger protein 212B-like isoform X1 n=3 Tax=Macrosteles quadrilineatus TaxID=74068 RepID=UPI0023E2E290|nr:RING finger protein 212B-like isoform X1 [Macrosteles quadrilineatus]XP_054270334.1 RING finger protein 212B-like isoform X1 [Macrosteles quadrilineatus]XP_054270336.1 RING finger protein 212B-like isoform X1 [Macrosteles quadrilineatus]
MDWVHCNNCYYRPGHQPKKEMILTSCGHIFCKCCERSAQIEHCKICGERANTTALSSQMIEQVKAYFEEPETGLALKLKVMEFQKSHRLRLDQYHKTVVEKYQKLKGEYQKLKSLYQKMEAEHRQMKEENMMYRRRLNAPPSGSSLFRQNSQESPFIRTSEKENRAPSSPFFVTPPRPLSSSQIYRNVNTPSTPMSDGSTSPISVTSNQSYRSCVSGRSSQKMYRPGLTPPFNRLSLLSVSAQRTRETSSRNQH